MWYQEKNDSKANGKTPQIPYINSNCESPNKEIRIEKKQFVLLTIRVLLLFAGSGFTVHATESGENKS